MFIVYKHFLYFCEDIISCACSCFLNSFISKTSRNLLNNIFEVSKPVTKTVKRVMVIVTYLSKQNI